MYIKAENEGGGRGQEMTGDRPIDTISAAAACLCTLFAEFGEEAEASDGRPGEDDGVLARDVLAELLGHEAVELRLVLQGGQTICTLALLQMDWNLQSGRKETGHAAKTDVEALFQFSLKYHFIVL